MHDWTDERMNERMGEWASEWVNGEGVNERVGECMIWTTSSMFIHSLFIYVCIDLFNKHILNDMKSGGCGDLFTKAIIIQLTAALWKTVYRDNQ